MGNRRFRVLLPAALLSCTLLFIACGGSSDNEQEYSQPGEVQTGDDVNTAAAQDTGLVVVDYLYEPGQESITGSIMNNSTQDYVNVQIDFRLLDAGGRQVGEASDTTSEVRPGDLWAFGVPIPPDQEVTRVEPIVVRGTPRGAPGQDIVPGSRDGAPGPTGPPRSEEPTTRP